MSLIFFFFASPFTRAEENVNEAVIYTPSSGEIKVMHLTLQEAVNLAIQSNRNIVSSRYGLQNQQLSLLSARSAFELKIVPTANAGIGGGGSESQNIGLGFSLQKKFEPGTVVSAGPETNKTDDEYNTSVGISVTQPLLKGFGKDINLDGIRSAEYSIKTAGRNLYQTEVNIVLETVSAFYETIKQKEFFDMYESLIERLKGHAEVAKAKERVGLTSPIDTFRAEISRKNAEDSLTKAVEAYKNAQDKLKSILSLPLETEIEVINPEQADSFDMGLENSIETAFKNRVELEQAEEEINEAERRAEILQNNALPELNLVFDYERFASADRFRDSASLDENRWGLSIQSATDVFRTAEKAAYKQGVLNIQTLRLNLENKKDEIKRQVRSQLNALREAKKRIDIRKEQIKQAEGKLALAEVKFAHGMADNFDVIEAETELQNAKVNLASSEVEYIIGTYNMRAILGTLIEKK